MPPCVGALDQLDRQTSWPGTEPSWSNITILYLSLQTRTYTWSNSELGTTEKSKKCLLTFNIKVDLSTAGRRPPVPRLCDACCPCVIHIFVFHKSERWSSFPNNLSCKSISLHVEHSSILGKGCVPLGSQTLCLGGARGCASASVLVTVAPRHVPRQSPVQGAQQPTPSPGARPQPAAGTLLPVCSRTRFSSKHLSTVGSVLVTARFGEFLIVMSGPPGAQDPFGGWKVNSVFMVTQTCYLLFSWCSHGPTPHHTGRGHRNGSWTGSRACESRFRSRWEEWGAREGGTLRPQGREVWKVLS